MPNRYRLEYRNPNQVVIHDRKHGDLVAAYVNLVRTVDGDGWRLNPLTVSRTPSRKLHGTPEDAIASMRYMTKAEAQADLASANAVRVALAHGAKITEGDNGLWQILDHPQTPLWFAVFRSQDYAARAYCLHHGLSLAPKQEDLSPTVEASYHYRMGDEIDGWRPIVDLDDDIIEGWAYKKLSELQGQDSDSGYVEYIEIDRDGERSFAVGEYRFGLGNNDTETIGRLDNFVFGSHDAIVEKLGAHVVERSPFSPSENNRNITP